MQGHCYRQLERKLKLLGEIDDEILDICYVEEIQHELEELAEIWNRILEAVRIIDKKTKAVEGNVRNTSRKVSSLGTGLDQPKDLYRTRQECSKLELRFKSK